MTKPTSQQNSTSGLTRRRMLQLSTAGATAAGAKLVFPGLIAAAESSPSRSAAAKPEGDLYVRLLATWCDGLVAHQETTLGDPALRGALLCPACTIVHGRCGDSVYPLLQMAHATGKAKYLEAALLVYEWSEQQVSRADGSWINDVTLSSWQGITVFHAIALAEALHYHGTILDTATRQRWTDRLAQAAKFLDGFISIETGNINYPVTASHCFALCGRALGEPGYLDRARQLAHASLDYFTANGLLFGEGHPQTAVTAKKCRAVDLGYNVEESLPALAQYALLTKDETVLEQAIAGLRAHMEFMLPDGGWDNSWGSRNYKWTWWGSRTSDGCHPAYVLLASHEPKFLEVAQRNLELMAACTHENVLYGGPHYFEHGDRPCIHHTFTHAKALATVLDSDAERTAPSPRLSIPRDEPYVVKSFPEIATHLASVGPWRATVTGYDFEYIERVQAGGGGAGGGGHASGGALSLLYHQRLGPILTASMTEYQMIEISNQQVHLDKPHMCLTPRIELAGKPICTSLSDFEAALVSRIAFEGKVPEVDFDANGRLLSASHQPPSTGEAHYHLHYSLTQSTIAITASVDTASQSSLRFILPVISSSAEPITQPDARTLHITKPKGTLVVSTNAPQGFNAISKERTFNLVPGFEAIPLTVSMQAGQQIQVHLEVV
ncbi:MAG TPA: hypothetical protein VHW70_16355 [Edaphobacter sp.]|nr:hypothetical protein [Edaphobacter sp.]